ncbi:zf-HC2 domain-containing protein [Alkaliphilus sp. B6464]|uniref:zf-HC2 domain-containing protein n=1 Tax=Alkaliphilus sp. B6464 TaxID=2731219 RepID=UPI001BAA68A2|nr:zf-HC2 domain-containing protein [Alkaliphilus sp. B6464]QUH18492.1 zf-HC2 domain-containing protein [Alkaliphilus sp. B6464]
MKATCNVIKDILPLYVENLASYDSCTVVEEHLISCNECKKELDAMKSHETPPIDIDISPLKKIKSTIRQKRLQAILSSIMITLIICFVAIAFLTAPEYLLYKEGLVSFVESDNGTILALFNDEVSGYDINVYPSQRGEGNVYHISTWNNIWNRNISKITSNIAILNPNGEPIDAVYYYTTDGNSDSLIYGKDQHPSGGLVTLPRLFLAYYLLIAITLTTLCILILAIFRRYKRITNATRKIIFLPISYILGHLLIKGFTTISYSATRDFYAILLVMIPLYIVFLFAFNIIMEHKRNKFK